MDGLDRVDLLPEPGEPRILSAIDSTTTGYHDAWRAEVTGWSPLPAVPIPRARRRKFLIGNVAFFALLVALMMAMWQSGLFFVQIPPPTSEWAFEAVQVRELADDGLTGEGVRVCMVDTGLSLQHPSLEGQEVHFYDLVGVSSSPIDYGAIAHGTLMAGLLLSLDHQVGISPNVTFAMVAALSKDSDGNNTADEGVVAKGINWCIDSFRADIISLSLGGEQRGEGREGPSVSAARRAVDNGIFVVAAAGNDGGPDDDGLVSVPGNIPRVITVGATNFDGDMWESSSMGSQMEESSSPRQNPHLKPEIVAPGESIISTGADNNWYSSSGTSDATVFVTGALALLLEAHPHLKADSNSDGTCIDYVKSLLMDSAKKFDNSIEHDDHWGYGLLQAKDWEASVDDSVNCNQS